MRFATRFPRRLSLRVTTLQPVLCVRIPTCVLTCWIVNIVGVRAGVEHHPFWVCAIQPSKGTGTVSGCLRLLPLATLDPHRPSPSQRAVVCNPNPHPAHTSRLLNRRGGRDMGADLVGLPVFSGVHQIGGSRLSDYLMSMCLCVDKYEPRS